MRLCSSKPNINTMLSKSSSGSSSNLAISKGLLTRYNSKNRIFGPNVIRKSCSTALITFPLENPIMIKYNKKNSIDYEVVNLPKLLPRKQNLKDAFRCIIPLQRSVSKRIYYKECNKLYKQYSRQILRRRNINDIPKINRKSEKSLIQLMNIRSIKKKKANYENFCNQIGRAHV